MTSPGDSNAGLCLVCANARRVLSGRGSAFWLCELSRTDTRFRRYPQLPVRVCPGFVEGDPVEPLDPSAGPGQAVR